MAITAIKSFPEVGSYLDIGANDPIRFSNTNLLYKKGWNGVNVEPNLTLFHKLEKFRPRDVNLNVAVGIGDKKTMFFSVRMHSRPWIIKWLRNLSTLVGSYKANSK